MTHEWLKQLKLQHQDLELGPPASLHDVDRAEESLNGLPEALRKLYAVSNGLRCRSFRVFPVYDDEHVKKTWDCIQRANDPATSDALAGDHGLLKRFLVFADIGNGYALMDRSDNTIWFEEGGTEEASQTDLDLRTFVELMVENAE